MWCVCLINYVLFSSGLKEFFFFFFLPLSEKISSNELQYTERYIYFNFFFISFAYFFLSFCVSWLILLFFLSFIFIFSSSFFWVSLLGLSISQMCLHERVFYV